MQRKTLVIGIAMLGVVGVAMASIWWKGDGGAYSETPPTEQLSGNSLAPGEIHEATNSSRLDLATLDGGYIRARDFLSDDAVVKHSSADGTYFLGTYASQSAQDQSGSTKAPYVIQYTQSTDLFVIALYSEPIGLARQDLEDDMLTQLGISRSDMCRLKYSVTTPWWVNQVYAGRDLKFSFCPGAVELPQ